MKKIILALLVTSSFISCKKDGYEVSGTAKGIENGKKVFIELMDDMGMSKAIDTGVVENGKFTIEGKLKEGIDLAFLKFEGNGSVPFILENGSIEVNFEKDSIQNAIRKGTTNNDLLQKYTELVAPVNKKAMKFQQDNQMKYMTAMQSQDTVTLKELEKQMQVFQKDMSKLSENFVKENNNSFISVLLINNFIGTKSMEISKIKTYYDKLDKELLSTRIGKKLKEAYEAQANTGIGSVAPDFSAPSPEGKSISLKSVKGKVTIIDFWASWCAPCRAENPNVVALYNEYHAKGLNIIGVSLDTDAVAWKEAIAKDGLTWSHVSNLKKWEDPIAKMYDVKGIPATFILDAQGKIVAKDLRGEALKAKVKELLGEK